MSDITEQSRKNRLYLEQKLEVNKRANNVAKFVFNDRQQKLYPNSIMYNAPFDYSQYIENVTNINDLNIGREKLIAESNLTKIGCNNEITKEALNFLLGYNGLYLVLFNTFFDDFTNYLSRTTKPPLKPLVFLSILKKYISEKAANVDIPNVVPIINNTLPVNEQQTQSPQPIITEPEERTQSQSQSQSQSQESKSDEDIEEETPSYSKQPKETDKQYTYYDAYEPIDGWDDVKKSVLQKEIKDYFAKHPNMEYYFKTRLPKERKNFINENKKELGRIITYINSPEFLEMYNYYLGNTKDEGSGLKRKTKKIIKGCGKMNDNYRKVNNLLVDVNKLKNGVFSIMYEKNRYKHRVPNFNISNDARDVLNDILDDKFDERFFNKLNGDEKNMVSQMIYGLQLKDNHNIVKSELDKLYNQFEIDRGEYISGNDNKELINRLKDTTTKLYRMNKLPRNVYKEVISELNG